ncbi:EAL domain-containing protein [Lichenicoccus sp.]|uniref:two-component system response regulator n=1 Tax=Lichenicoccus sp. TaxID=2781899 RepID=UPI003D10B22D
MTLIAILDDRASNRQIYARLAATINEGVAAHTFCDAPAALSWAEQTVPDLVITDYKMPALDGAEFTRRFRRLAGCADVPVLVITAYDDRAFRLAALQAGATDFLRSPVDHAEFVTRSRNMLRMYNQHRLLQTRAERLEIDLRQSERSREKLLRDSRESLVQVIDTVPAAISARDRQGRTVFANAMHARLAGDAAAVFGEVHESHSSLLDQMVFRTGNALLGFEEEVVDQTGAHRILLTTKSPLRNGSDEVESVLTTSLDITERKRAEQRLAHMASHDPLTDLPNRTLLRERLERRLGQAPRSETPLALHFIDLDRFKEANDRLGHHLGDMVLKQVARRLVDLAGPGSLVARLGGDEFAVLQDRCIDNAAAEALARRIVEALRMPFNFGEEQVRISCSVGIALHPTDGSEVEELLRCADLAMYQAKAEGRSGFRLFVPDLNERALRAVRIKADLRGALACDEFVLHYQPQVTLQTGRISGVEALLRWNRPGYGLLMPGEFLTAAQESGLLGMIDDWVLRRACAEAAGWHAKGLPRIRVAVNLSPTDLAGRNILGTVTDVLAQTGLDPARLELELTEGDLVEDPQAAAAVLLALRSLGVKIAIDDFGMGYSSLAYVKNFPVDRLKIDRAFVRDLGTVSPDAAIVRAIVALGHSLGMSVMAEGVETVTQLSLLMVEGCDEIQGYYFSRPVPAGELEDILQREQALQAPLGTLT